jgi:DNA-binding HxlR family transcriptional regulator
VNSYDTHRLLHLGMSAERAEEGLRTITALAADRSGRAGSCGAGRSMRFYLLRDRIGGISEKMLSQNLRTFVRDGLVAREVEPTVPPQVTYSLTPLGQELAGTLGLLVQWVTRRMGDITAAREQHDRA